LQSRGPDDHRLNDWHDVMGTARAVGVLVELLAELLAGGQLAVTAADCRR
jgi:hypothetical protein